jgi:hypothetical protein
MAAQLTALADKRRSYALASVEGDERARQAIADTDFETDALKREQTTVLSAIETGEALEAQRALEAEAKERHEREVHAYSAARAVCTLNIELDEALVHLRELFERRAILLKDLGDTGVVDLGLIVRLNHRSLATASAQLAGLSKYFALEMTPASAVRPLSVSNELLLTIGAEPPAKANGKGDASRPARRPVHD